MDYLLGDPLVTPPTEESHFTERVWRMPNGYLCFAPPDIDLSPAELPAAAQGYVTFGCFNNLAKMNDAVVSVWARVLHVLPTARLLLKTAQLDDVAAVAKTRERFAAHGIAADRILLEGHAPRAQLLAAYGRVDIALDPFPYPGGTTSAEALWMGVPVVTRKGDRFVSHVGETVAYNAGLAEWIAADDDDYVRKAVAAAADLPRLAELRSQLRNRLPATPLFDARRFARDWEDAMWGMWRDRSVAT
jgi:predicted O-linked N-acetylglucosamine transferase (SPINDLY family)